MKPVSTALKIKRIVELVLVLPLYAILRLLPFAAASFLIGKLTRLFGRFHASHKTALKNLRFCFPEKTETEIKSIALNSWENLGRVAGELPHIATYTNDRILEICPISNLQYVDEAEKLASTNNSGFILVSAHVGNWEIASRILLVLDPETAFIYRKANNPYIEDVIQKMRNRYTSFIIQKGDRAGVRDIIKHIKSGGRLGILSDQKMSDGVEVEFFGTKVKAPPTAGEMATKYNIPIVMGRAIRDEKTKVNFVQKFDAPIITEGKNAQQVTQEIYNTFERWIREYPNQWFWQHNRFNLRKS